MIGKGFKWKTHLEAAEGSGLSLAGYAQKHRIDVRRLYEARPEDATAMLPIV